MDCDDIFRSIFGFLDWKSAARNRLVCVRWMKMILDGVTYKTANWNWSGMDNFCSILQSIYDYNKLLLDISNQLGTGGLKILIDEIFDKPIYHDRGFWYWCVKLNIYSYTFINPLFMDDEEIAMCAVTRNSAMLRRCSNKILDNIDVCYVALKGSKAYELFDIMSARVRSLKKIVELYVSLNGLGLEKVGLPLIECYEICRAAVLNNQSAFKFVPHNAPWKSKLCIDMILKWKTMDVDIIRQYNNDREFIVGIVKINGELLQYVTGMMRTNRFIVRTAVNLNGIALRFAKEFSCDFDICRCACLLNIQAIEFVDRTILNKLGDEVYNREYPTYNVNVGADTISYIKGTTVRHGKCILDNGKRAEMWICGVKRE